MDARDCGRRATVAESRSIVRDRRVVPLIDFTPLPGDADLQFVRSLESEIYANRDRLKADYPGYTTYLPFQFRSDGLRFASYYFGKLPRELVNLLFESGSGGPSLGVGSHGTHGSAPAVRRHFLQGVERARGARTTPGSVSSVDAMLVPSTAATCGFVWGLPFGRTRAMNEVGMVSGSRERSQ